LRADVRELAAARVAPPAGNRHALEPEEQLVAHYGWVELGRRIDIRCFTHDPSVGSSLHFLRRTPWTRAKVEALYAPSLAARTGEPREG
jgi:uncharacterized protein (DUF2132 family)